MQGSKQYQKENNIIPRISFKDGKGHRVELVKDKMETMTFEGEEKTGVKYLVKENGTPKSFFTSSEALISKLADLEEGAVVEIIMKSVKLDNGQWGSRYEVKQDGGQEEDDGIPIIEEDKSEQVESEKIDDGIKQDIPF